MKDAVAFDFYRLARFYGIARWRAAWRALSWRRRFSVSLMPDPATELRAEDHAKTVASVPLVGQVDHVATPVALIVKRGKKSAVLKDRLLNFDRDDGHDSSLHERKQSE